MVRQCVRQHQLTEMGERRTGNSIDYTFDDLGLPPADEMAKYKQVSPDMIKAIVEIAKKEQAHRHLADFRKLDIIKGSDGHIFSMNLWGMVFSVIIIVAMLLTMVTAIYFNSTWLSAASAVAFFLYLSTIIANFIGNKREKSASPAYPPPASAA